MSQKPMMIYTFGAYRLDPRERTLTRAGETVTVTPKVFDALVILLQNQGRLVEKPALTQALWADTVVEDASLTRLIYEVRKTVDDAAHNWVQTVPKFGYRFVGEVTEVADPVPPPISLPPPISVPDAPPPTSPRLPLAPLLLVLPVVAGLFYFLLHKPGTSPGDLRFTAITSDPGEERDPSISPDGSQVAFSWNGPQHDNFDIYRKTLRDDRTIRITTAAAKDSGPAWSPDGGTIAFLRNAGDEGEVFLISSLGGIERQLCRSNGWSLSWTPDSLSLIVMNRDAPDKPYTGYIVSIHTGVAKPITAPPASAFGDYDFIVSPDGKNIAFTRMLQIGFTQVMLGPLAGGDFRPILQRDGSIYGLAWTPHSDAIVFSNAPLGGLPVLWKIAARDGARPTPIPGIPAAARRPSIPRLASSVDRIAYERFEQPTNIWLYPGSDPAANPEPLHHSTRSSSLPQFSPIDNSLVFASNRSGNWEIWTCRRDGSELHSLTQNSGLSSGSPQWSPDGSHIVFDARAGRQSSVFLTDSAGSTPRRLTTGDAAEIRPVFSADGRSIYFASNRSGSYEIWKMPARGGSPVQVTRYGGYEAQESLDGQTLYFVKGRDRKGLYAIPAGGGPEQLIHDSVSQAKWQVTQRGIVYLDGSALVWVFDSSTLKRLPIRSTPIPNASYLTASRDGTLIAATQFDPVRADLELVEGTIFR